MADTRISRGKGTPKKGSAYNPRTLYECTSLEVFGILEPFKHHFMGCEQLTACHVHLGIDLCKL